MLGAAGPWAAEVWTVTDVGRGTRLARASHAPHTRHTRRLIAAARRCDSQLANLFIFRADTFGRRI